MMIVGTLPPRPYVDKAATALPVPQAPPERIHRDQVSESTELTDQNPELLSDLYFKDILTPSPASQT